MKYFRNLSVFVLPLLLFLVIGCHPDSEQPDPIEYGLLSLNISLTVTAEEANGRVLATNTDDFKVTIFSSDGTEVMVFDPFSSAPAEVSLPTGEYYVEAHSNNLVDAAFENPYYFGRSDNFTIDKEEIKSIDLTVELANTKVAINYSEVTINTFDIYSGEVTVVATGSSLFYGQGETREGYFVTQALDIEINLSYVKLDGSTIDRTFTTSIPSPQPKTLYNINVDAMLDDGKIMLNIIVDEGFETIDIELSDEGESTGSDPNVSWSPNESWTDPIDGQSYSTVQIGDQVWMAENLRATNYADGTAIAATDILDGDPVYGKYYTFNGATNGGAISNAIPSGVQGVCPNGWHLPSLAEYQQLGNYLGASEAGSKMKSNSILWNPTNVEVADLSGFNGEPSGWHHGSSVSQTGDAGIWWTTTEYAGFPNYAYGFLIYYGYSNANPSQSAKTVGKCVRCLKN